MTGVDSNLVTNVQQCKIQPMFITKIPSHTLLMNIPLPLYAFLMLFFILHYFSFRTGKGVGYSAHFSGPMLVLECTVKSGKRENKVLHHLVKFEFHPQKVSMSDNNY